MGMIEKAIRGKQNQKFAEPIRVATALSINEVVAAVHALVATHEEPRQVARTKHLEKMRNGGRLARWAVTDAKEQVAKQYYVTVESKQILVGWLGVPAKILAIKKPGTGAKYWLAAITFPSEKPSQYPNGTYVEVRLKKWIIDSNGRLQSKQQYETFCEQLFGRITDANPSTTA